MIRKTEATLSARTALAASIFRVYETSRRSVWWMLTASSLARFVIGRETFVLKVVEMTVSVLMERIASTSVVSLRLNVYAIQTVPPENYVPMTIRAFEDAETTTIVM